MFRVSQRAWRLGLFLILPLIATLIWPLGGGGGLLGTLAFLHLDFLSKVAEAFFGIVIGVMLLVAILSSVGEYHFKEHVRDIAPFALVLWTIVLLSNLFR